MILLFFFKKVIYKIILLCKVNFVDIIVNLDVVFLDIFMRIYDINRIRIYFFLFKYVIILYISFCKLFFLFNVFFYISKFRLDLF